MPQKTTNVVALPQSKLPALHIAATSGEGNRISGSRNEVWLFPAYTSGQPVKLYVKVGLSARAMMVEVLCTQLAVCLGIGASVPYLVTVRPQHAGRPAGPVMLAFGVEDVSERSMARPIRSLDVMFDMLERLKVADLACAFDEWILNDVRSPSDILVGAESHVYFIDHEAALPEGLEPMAKTTNWLADRMLERLEKSERPAFLRKLRSRLAALQRLQLSDVPDAVQFCQGGISIYTSLLEFLRLRLTHLDQIMSQRVHPDQQYIGQDEPNLPAVKNVPR